MKQVGIIGAGISGLAAAKAFLQKGYSVTVLEKAGSIGGVWEQSRSYIGVATQTTRDEYAFSDFPMPADYPMWPCGKQVQAYLEQYAHAFGVMSHICFNTEVQSLQYDQGRWSIQARDRFNDTVSRLDFDFIAVCTGTFHKPYLPVHEGMQSFVNSGGTVLHSSQVTSSSVLEGKSVAVVGFAKSATDIASIAADLGNDCTLLYRKAQWKVPRFFGNKVNMRHLLFSRFSEAFFDNPYKTTFQQLLHSVGKPLVWAQWRGLEALLKMQFKLKACGMLPEHRIEDQISCSLGVAPEGFYKKVLDKKIKAKRTEINHFENRNVVLKNGETIRPEIIVYGTGFTQELPFLDDRYKNTITDTSGGYRLYRNIVNPKIPQLGFVGYNSSLFTTLSSEVAANWLAAFASNELQLPPAEAIEQEIDYMMDWRRNKRPASAEFSGTCVAPFNFMHLDMLMKDMGLPSMVNRMPHQYFKPINPKDYHILLRSGKKQVHKKPAPIRFEPAT